METLGNVNDVFSMTFYTYDRIRKESGKKGDSAVSLYIRYIEQARLQGTDSTYSTDKFMMKAMGWSNDKFYAIKPILQKLGLIELKENRDESGKIISHYIQVNFVIKGETTTVLKNQTPEKPDSGKSETNTICTKYKCLNTKNKIHVPFETFRTEFPHARKGKKAESKKYYEQLDTNEVMKQVQILKRQIRAGLEDSKRIPACERWIRDFTPLNEDVVKQKLVRICKRHLNAEGDMKQRSQELKQTFGDEQINKIVKAIQQQNSPKNLFIKP